MNLLARKSLPPLVAAAAIVLAGCTAATPRPSTSDGTLSIEGTIVSVDTQPWAYDGNAVVILETPGRGQFSVQLPARWNLCKAPAVDVPSLTVGAKARAVGTAGAEREIVVCGSETHRLEVVE
jgi:hypothetical protein